MIVLQGNFDIFSLTELIGMLSSGTKTGTLEVLAGRVQGRFHLKDGLCSGVEPGAAPPGSESTLATALVSVCFDLSRDSEGEFRFITEEPPLSDYLVAVDDPLAEVARLLEQWRVVQGYIPSLDLCPRLRPELAGEAITLSASEWSLAVSLDGRRSVRSLVGAKAASLLAVCQQISNLVERGAIQMGEPLAPPEPEPVASLEPEPLAQHESTETCEAPHRPGQSVEVSLPERTSRGVRRYSARDRNESGDYEAPVVVPVAPYGPGVDEPAVAEVSEGRSARLAPVSSAGLALGEEGPGRESLEDSDVKDRGALLRMFSALRDA